MPKVTTTEMFKKAQEGKYAIGAFNINNMEIIQAVVNAADKERSPLILAISPSAIKYAGLDYLMVLCNKAIENTDIPIAIHLDHGMDFETCKKCIDIGFSSVMIDGSKLSYEENIALTRQVVDYAHERGVVVEAELGKLAGIEGDEVSVAESDAAFTDPEQAWDFIEKSGCDSLAVAIGTSHGAYKFKSEPRLRFDILQRIIEKVNGTPLVLHGASSVMQEYLDICNANGGNIPNAKGVPPEMLQKAGEMGIQKINADTDIRLTMTAGIRKFLKENPDTIDVRAYTGLARDMIEEMIRNKIKNDMHSNNKI
ncbi:MAG: ketose-bisphosphate aldolase [Clostridia bacterium]|nr:ketose-bisphosphate aldolase [Clostridia bacterium]